MNQEHPSPPRPTLTDQLRARTRFIIDPVVATLAHFKLSPALLTVVRPTTHIAFALSIAIADFPRGAPRPYLTTSHLTT